jgi:ABC-type enterochelin transport system ATPase subunit
MDFFFMLEPTGSKQVGVLLIVGPAGLGKSTLVAYVCNVKRAHNNFTRIVLITKYDLKGKGLTTLEDGVVVYRQHNSLNENERTFIYN